MSTTSYDSTPIARSWTVISPKARWAGRIISGILALLLGVGAAYGLSGAKAAVEGTVAMGWQPHHVPIIGTLELLCLVLYLIPRTAPIGAVLLSAYFGGAVATHLRVNEPLVTILTPVFVSTLLWIGLYLRDVRVRALVHAAH